MVRSISRALFLLLMLLCASACGGGGGGGGAAPPGSTGGGGGGGATNRNNLLNGNYFAVAGVVGAQDATVIGPVTLNGNGGLVGAGALTIRTALGLANANVTPSVYAVDNSRNTTATVNTDAGITLQQTQGRTTADGLVMVGLSNSQGSQGMLLLVRRAVGLTNAALAGTLRVNLGFVTPAAPGIGGGTLTLGGAGNLTGGQLTDAQGQVSNVNGGNYNVDANGGFTATVNLANGRTFNLVGAVGQDGSVIFAFDDGLGDFGFGAASETPAGASNASLNGSLGVFTLGLAGSVGFAGGSATFNGAGLITGGQLVTHTNQLVSPVTGNYNVAANGTAQVQMILQGLVTVNVNGHLHESGNVATGTGVDTQGGRNFSALVR